MDKIIKTVSNILTCLIAFLFLISTAGCSSGRNVTVMKAMPESANLATKKHKVIVAEAQTVDTYLTVSAMVSYDETEDLYFTIDNCNLKAIYVSVNEEVEEGQLLAELDTSDLESRIAARQVDLKRVQLKYDQYQNESEMNPSDLKVTLESLKLDMEAIELDIAHLEELIGKTKLVAPFSGMITYVKGGLPGTEVLAYDQFMTIWKPDSIKLVSDVLNPSTSSTSAGVNLAGITKGMEVVLIYGSKSKRAEIPATVTSIINTDPGVLDDANRILASAPPFQLCIKPDEPDPDKLFVDHSLTLRIKTGELENAIVLPKDVIRGFGNDRIVKVVKGDKIINRLVTIGFENNKEGTVIITSGIRPGENILAD